MIYFDHAASSFPKPQSVAKAMYEAVDSYGANPGRGGHQLAETAKNTIDDARKKLAQLFNAPSGKHVWFYQNATMALNQALIGFPFEEGDHVVTTMFEHNSMIRPLEKLRQEKKITVTYVKPNEEGVITAEAIKAEMSEHTKMIAVSHASNVTGAYVDLLELSSLKQEGMVFVVDASQTAGTLPIDMEADQVDLLAFAGHKSLLGPQGTGVLISRGDYGLSPLVVGGTGSYSELTEQPKVWPDRYEAGTLNTPGIAGLSAGVDEVMKKGINVIYEHEQELLKHFVAQIKDMPTMALYGPRDLSKRVAVCSFKVEGVESHELAMILDDHYQIAVRAGLHCAPKVHESLKTSDAGLVRVSFGPYNTLDEVDQLVKAIREISQAFQGEVE